MVPKLPVIVLLAGLAGTGYGLYQQISVQRQINQQTILVANALTQTHGLLAGSNTRLSQLSHMTTTLSQINDRLVTTIGDLAQGSRAMTTLLNEQTAIAKELNLLNHGLSLVHNAMNQTAGTVQTSNALTAKSLSQVNQETMLIEQLGEETTVTIQQLDALASKTALLRKINQTIP